MDKLTGAWIFSEKNARPKTSKAGPENKLSQNESGQKKYRTGLDGSCTGAVQSTLKSIKVHLDVDDSVRVYRGLSDNGDHVFALELPALLIGVEVVDHR